MPTCFNTTPDYTRLTTILSGKQADRVPLYEFYSDTRVQLEAIGDWPMEDALPQGDHQGLNDHIRAQYYLGYDYLSPWVEYGFTGLQFHKATTSEGNDRYFVDDHNAAIKNREDFERYQWPTPDTVSYTDLEYCAGHLPEGMKLVVNLGGGLLEWACWLMGLENFCMTIYDDPDLITEMLTRINEQQVTVCRTAASHPDVIAVTMGDDMGFKTQTFLPPAQLREYILPGLKRIVDAAHSHGKLFIFHSCGNLEQVMDDLIDNVGIDAKHSFEDVIMPVTEVKRIWGDRVALVGGVDIDFLCRAHETDLRSYVRRIVETCGKSGGFALGSGNSIANYIPPASLRVMLDEAIRCQNV